jgi:hypothetical protein
MTCKIDRVLTNDRGVVLRVSGHITGPDVETLRAALEQEEQLEAVDLRDVLLIDREAAKFLALCEMKGIALNNCPTYIREWVTRERAQLHTHRDE